jgi:ribosomal protein S12 methylthiotransferase accessory factor
MATTSPPIPSTTDTYPSVAPVVSGVDRMDQLSPYGAPVAFHLAAARSAAVLQWDGSGRLIQFSHELRGSGTDYRDRELAGTRALAEVLERQTGYLHADLSIITATSSELGSQAIRLDRIPRCSQREFDDPRCPLVRPDVDMPLDWVLMRSLTNGERRLVPLQMVLLGSRSRSPEKRLVLPISTGYAAHRTPAEALLAGLAEIVERDAIALAWEARLPLPLLDPELLTANARAFLDADRARGVESILFDATTDVDRVAVVYCLQRDRHNRSLRHAVHCSAALDATAAAEKVLRESISTRLAIARCADESPVTRPEQILQVADGAVYMGDADRAEAFDFLLHTSEVSAPPEYPRGDAAEELEGLVRQLENLGCEVYALDVTSRSAARHGLTVVRVVVLGLLPMSLSPFARYRAEQRLYSFPAARYGMSLREDGLNPWPQPFA